MENQKQDTFPPSCLAMMEDELANKASASFHAIRQICSSLDESEYRKVNSELVRLTCYFVRCSGLSHVRAFYEGTKCAPEQVDETLQDMAQAQP